MKQPRSRSDRKFQALILRTSIILAVPLLMATGAAGQKRGVIAGAPTPPTTGVVVVATNQVPSRVTRARATNDGRYSITLRPGAYRLSIAPPYFAKFDKTKNYGQHALIRENTLENVIVSAGKETKIDFAIEKKDEKAPVNIPERKPL